MKRILLGLLLAASACGEDEPECTGNTIAMSCECLWTGSDGAPYHDEWPRLCGPSSSAVSDGVQQFTTQCNRDHFSACADPTDFNDPACGCICYCALR